MMTSCRLYFFFELALHLAVGNIVQILDLDADDAALLADREHTRDGRARDAEHLTDLLLPPVRPDSRAAALKDETYIVNNSLHREPLS